MGGGGLSSSSVAGGAVAGDGEGNCTGGAAVLLSVALLFAAGTMLSRHVGGVVAASQPCSLKRVDKDRPLVAVSLRPICIWQASAGAADRVAASSAPAAPLASRLFTIS